MPCLLSGSRPIPNFGSYAKVIEEAHIARAFLNSLIVTVPTVVTTVFFSSLAGYAFAKFRSRGLDILFTMILAIMMIPLTVILIPMYITAWELKLLDTHVGLMLPRLMSAFGIFLFRQMMATFLTNSLMRRGLMAPASSGFTGELRCR